MLISKHNIIMFLITQDHHIACEGADLKGKISRDTVVTKRLVHLLKFIVFFYSILSKIKLYEITSYCVFMFNMD